MKPSTLERYLLTILHAEEREGVARTSAIAETLGVTPSSVSETCSKLARCGLVAWRPYRGFRLTDRGMAIVKSMQQRSEVLMNFFTMIGVNAELAREEANRMASEISDEFLRRLDLLLGQSSLAPLDISMEEAGDVCR